MRVLVGTDGSECAASAIDLVARTGWPDESVIQVVDVVEEGTGLFGGPWPVAAGVNVAELEADLMRTAQQTVEGAVRRIQRPGVAVAAKVLRGRPAAMIVDAARTIAADVIVVGSRGHGTIESMVLGSVSAEVVDRARIPVLVARGQIAPPIILAWDGSPCAQAAADLLVQWPIVEGMSCHVVTVADARMSWWAGVSDLAAAGAIPLSDEASPATREALSRIAEEMVDKLRGEGVTAVAELRDGDAATQIIEAARQARAGLIVMGTHGRTGLARVFLGSVARNVLHHAPCSVLIVREPPPEGRPE